MTSLADLRTQIDALDAELLRLIDARAALGQAIGAAKAKEAGNAVAGSLLRPDREAMLIRKLLNMPRQAASDGVVVRIWRELISENLRIQGGLHLNLSSADHSQEVLVWARERFGFAPSFTHLNGPQDVIAAARDPRHIGVLSLDPRGGAWWARLLVEPRVRIIAALPEQSTGRPHGVAIAALTPEPTGDDITFFVSDSSDHENRIIETLGRLGFAAEWLCSAQGLKLFGLAGYVQENDLRLGGALGSLSGIIGAAPRL